MWLVARHFLIFRTGKGGVSIEITQDYTILFNAATDVIEKLEQFPIQGMPEIEECIRILKEAQQAAEELNISGYKP